MASKKIAKKRLDKYYHLAKEQGYRARSAYKLIQLNKKFNFLSSCTSLVDLCCAPGGWLQVALQHKIKSVLGVDMYPFKKIGGVTQIVGDITENATYKEVLHLAGEVDCVLHDGAPNVGTCWEKDAFVQNELVLHAIKIMTKILKRGGIFLTKIFRSKDYFSILWVLNQFFEQVISTKPISSREESAEIFVFCRGYKRPSKIDEKLFDANHVFNDEIINENYFKVIKFTEFFKAKDPKSILETYSKILLDVKGAVFDKIFDENFKLLLDDLRQISRHDVKRILKKREKLIKLLEKGEFVENLEVLVRETTVEFEEESGENDGVAEGGKLGKIQRELKRKERGEKKTEFQKKVKMAKSKVFENLANIDNFFEDRLFQNASVEKKKSKKVKGRRKEQDEKGKGDSDKTVPGLPSDRMNRTDDVSSDEESMDLNSEDKRLIVEMQQDREAFELRTVNRYATNDTEKIPEFYLEEQNESNQFKSLVDSKNYKKERKKDLEVMNRRVRRALKFKKEIMEEISDENEKPKRLFKSCLKKSKKKPKVVVCSRGRPARAMKGRVRYVDRRMKKDLRMKKKV